MVKALDLVVPPPRSLPNRRAWKRDKGVGLVWVRGRGRILVLTQRLGRDVWRHRRVGGEGLNLHVGIDDPCGSSRRSRTVVGRIGEAVVVTLLRTVIGRGGVAVGPGVDGIGRTGVVEGWRGVCRAGRVVVTRVEGTISRWMGTAEESGFRHPAMVDGRVWGGVEGRGGVSLV